MYRTVLQVRNQLQMKLLKKKSADRVLTEPLHCLFVYVIFNETLSLCLARMPFSINYVCCETIPFVEA